MKGRNVKVRYQKLIGEKKVWRFNERNGQLEEMTFQRDAKEGRSQQQENTGRKNN